MSEYAHMSPEESAEYNQYLDEQKYREEHTETNWPLTRENPLSPREQAYLTIDEQQLYQQWLTQPLSGHSKINFKAMLKKVMGIKHWLNGMAQLDSIHAQLQQTETYKQFKQKQALLDEIDGPRYIKA